MPDTPASLLHPRIEIARTIERIYQYRMTTTSGGNLSVRDENGDVWITPARVDKGDLRPGDICRVSPGGAVAGPHPPSSEYPFHAAVYAARPDVRAIVHAHPVALVAFSICGQSPNTALFPQAQHVCGKVGFAPYALPGSEALGRNIAQVFRDGADCVMLENHGVVVGGADLQQAFQRFETLEFCAKTVIKASHLGPVRYLDAAELARARGARPTTEPGDLGPTTTAEKEARHLVADFVRRGYRQRLLTSTEGSFSARLGEDDFVITGYGVDRFAAAPENLARVRGGRHEAGRVPSRAAAIHRAIYQRHPAIKAVVNAMPVNATAFSVSAAAVDGKSPLDARTIPESYVFLRDVAVAPYGIQFGEPSAVAAVVSRERPVALVQNDGVLVAGTSVLDAFDRLEVLEATAEALINARSIGPVHPMNDEAIKELIEAFFGPKKGK